MKLFRICGAFFFALIVFPVFAQDDSRLQALAESQQWHQLLHVRYHPFTFRTISQNDSERFFLSSDGKENPYAELLADIAAFAQSGLQPDESAQCRFPARYQWLKTKLENNGFIDQPCPAFEQWRDELDADAIALIFPASHINSPSSMYGHTLIRLDRSDERRSKLLAYAVNFAANADPTDNELVFSYKGLAGGYPGVASVMPYYVKTNEYQHMEYRDVWEYRLTLTSEEVDQFVRHVWELQDTYFDYFFFDENCSYRIIAMLDAASERVNLADDFVYKAVPVDTIRALWQGDLVDEVTFRASAATELETRSRQVSAEVLGISRRLIDERDDIDGLLKPLSQTERAQALELAAAYARYLSIKKKQGNPELRQRTLAVLSARSRIPVSAGFDNAPTPQWRDDEGHLTQRLGIRAGRISGAETNTYTDVRLRMAYHDVIDLPAGFVDGSQIQMGQFDLRRWGGDGALRLQNARIIDVLSLSHQTAFQHPVAWAVSFGAERYPWREAELYGYLKVAFGKAWLTDAGRVYGMGEVRMLADNQFEQGYQLSAGPRLGWLWQGEQLQFQLEGNWQALNAGDDTEQRSLEAVLGLRISSNDQLRFEAGRQVAENNDVSAASNQFSLTWNRYF